MSRPAPVRWRRWLGALLVLATLATAVAGLAALRVHGAADDLDAAVGLIDDASRALEEGRLGDARADLDGAYERIRTVNASLYGPAEIDLAAGVPIVSANLTAVRDGVALATRLIDGGRNILRAAVPLESSSGQLEVSLSNGSLPLGAVAASQREIADLLPALPARPPARRAGVVGPIRRASATLYAEAARRRAQLGVLDRGLSLLTDLAGGDGDRRYLIAVSNTAEMRGSGGMILNYGVLEGRAGTIDLTAFGRIDELAFTGPVPDALVPADYLARWSGFEPLSRWRNATLAGDFGIGAPVLEAMYTKATGLPVNGVIQIDPEGLAALLDGVGPVQVPEVGQVDGTNVVDLTLNRAYVQFPGVEDRTDVLGDVAEAGFRRLVDGDIPSLRTLATRLVEAVDGRHLLVHATGQAPQASLSAFGADGALPSPDVGDSMMLTAQNLAGNKLDYYLDSNLAITGERRGGEIGTLDVGVTLTNTAPIDVVEPRYIFGPGPTVTPLPAGVERALVTLYLPTGTSVTGTTGDATLETPVVGTEGGRTYVSFTLDVPAGAARVVRLGLRLAPRAPGPYRLLLVPSPRVRPTTATVSIATGAGTVAGHIESDRTWSFSEGRPPAQVAAPAFR